MAERVDKLPAPVGRGPRPGYPWEEWLDGSVWKLTRGEDFDCTTKTFREMAARRMSGSDKRVTTRVNGDVVYIQAVDR